MNQAVGQSARNGFIEAFDTTLRDGAQCGGISYSVEDKINIMKALDKLGVSYIEAGNPFSNPKDMEFFERAAGIPLVNAKLVAFGSTRRRDTAVGDDNNCAKLLLANTPVVAIFGKSWLFHVREVIGVSLMENCRMIYDTVNFMLGSGKRVIYDAEHFFDGYKDNAEYALQTIEAAADAGASHIVLCDTNGGCFPDEIFNITKVVADKFKDAVTVGIHCHNDIGCAVADSLMAVKAGARHVQGTLAGIGERCGNASLCELIPSLQIKLGYNVIPEESLKELTRFTRYVSEISNIVISENVPYVGKNAFAHKGGMHIDAVLKNPATFEHVQPEAVGNERQILISEVSGRAALLKRLAFIDPGLSKESASVDNLLERLKKLELEGYQFESAQASFELLILKFFKRFSPYFEVEFFKVMGEHKNDSDINLSSALVKVKVGTRSEITGDEGVGPVDALDKALRKAIELFYPEIRQVRLIDYKVRVVEPHMAAAAKVRVFIVSTDGDDIWTTVGVSGDILDASFKALMDSINYRLVRSAANINVADAENDRINPQHSLKS